MIKLDEDALICDFAEFYHIYDYQALSASYAATLASGLRSESRIRTLMSDRKASIDTILLAGIADRLAVLLSGSEAKLISSHFITVKEEPEYGFETGADFDAAWAADMEKLRNGGRN